MDTLGFFNEICGISHCSFDTQKLGDYLLNFAKSSGFNAKIDEFGNIHAIKGKPKVCLQAHYDMVCVGLAPVIKLQNDGLYLSALNSSLGADNGIGVAICMKMMTEIENLELLFTNNEEVGMLGAAGFKGEIKSKFLLNLDSECDEEIINGCAGGVLIKLSLESTINQAFGDIYEISVRNLPGGHSGVEIYKNIPNAIKILAEFLEKNKCEIISFNGGERTNSIPANAHAIAFCANGFNEKIQNKADFISIKKIQNFKDNFILEKTKEILAFLNALKHGIYEPGSEPSTPKSSANLATIATKISNNSSTLNIQIYARAMDNESLEKIKNEISAKALKAGFSVFYSEQSAPWASKQNDFAKIVLEILQKYRPNAKITSIHAGLECGILCANALKGAKSLQACSIGPNIISPHSTHEKCEIASVYIIEKVVREVLAHSLI